MLTATIVIGLCFAGLFLSEGQVQARVPHLTAAITNVSARDHRVSSVAVKTLARAALTIQVVYFCTNHLATSKSLRGTEYANRIGVFVWTWTPDTKCHGNARATVTAREYGQTVKVWKVFSVA